MTPSTSETRVSVAEAKTAAVVDGAGGVAVGRCSGSTGHDHMMSSMLRLRPLNHFPTTCSEARGMKCTVYHFGARFFTSIF